MVLAKAGTTCGQLMSAATSDLMTGMIIFAVVIVGGFYVINSALRTNKQLKTKTQRGMEV